MIKVALRGLAGRKLRAVLTGIAIVLGVAMISGTYVLTDTIDQRLQEPLHGVVRRYRRGRHGPRPGRLDRRGEPAGPTGRRVPAPDRARRLRGRPGDREHPRRGQHQDPHAGGRVRELGGSADVRVRDRHEPAVRAVQPAARPRRTLARLDDEVVIDASTADKQGYAVGDTVEITTLQPKRPFELVGVAQYGTVDSLGNATFAVFTIPAAQELLDREGQYDAISAAAKEGTSEDELVAGDRAGPAPGSAVVSASAESAEAQDEVSDFTSIFRYFLLTFAGIALFVGAFVIFNTFSITVAQRTREFATLRTIGASRRQVLGSVILESLVIGLLASLVGLGLGVLIAEGIEALFGSFGIELPSADRVFALRTVIVALIVGVGVTLAAGLFPAIRATRVPPIAAVREGATLPPSRFARYTPWIAGLVVVLSIVLLARAMFTDELGTGDRLLSIAAGVLLLFLGVAMLASRLVRPIAAVVGLPARSAGGAAGRLASGNSVRNPGRTASTAAALMIGSPSSRSSRRSRTG